MRRLAIAAYWIAFGCAVLAAFIAIRLEAPAWMADTAVGIGFLLTAPLCFIALRDLYGFLEALIRG